MAKPATSSRGYQLVVVQELGLVLREQKRREQVQVGRVGGRGLGEVERGGRGRARGGSGRGEGGAVDGKVTPARGDGLV